MTRTVPSARPGEQARDGREVVLSALAATTLALVAAQFALAGLGAFTMVKTPGDNAYRAHMILGMVIGLAAWLILAATLASRPARAHRKTVGLAATLAVLAIPVEPLLAAAGHRVPFVGALHALNGVAIFALTGWVLAETSRRRAARQAWPKGKADDTTR